MIGHRFFITVASLGIAVAALAVPVDAAAGSIREPRADGTYCYRGNYRSRLLTCTLQSVPSSEADAQAKQFVPDPSSLTVYVVRSRWSDAINRIDLRLDDRSVASMVPNSFVRLRLRPGEHRVSFQWQGQSIERNVDGEAGEIAVVELAGSLRSWRSRYWLEGGDLEVSRDRIVSSRLVADRDLTDSSK